jgi:hypothetical protein
MSYRLKFDEPVDKAWQRIVREQIDNAVALLSSSRDQPIAVHETRKAIKRIRALLKLLRSGLSDDEYSKQNARFAEIGRILSGTRDRDVLIATAQELSQVTRGKSRAAALAIADHGINRANGKARPTRASQKPAGDPIEQAIAALKAAGKAVDRLNLKSNSFDVVRRGIAKSYRRGRRAMERSYETDTDEEFHEWRKWLQAHWRHLALVSRAWPDLFEARMKLAKEMSDLLGADHDLYMLIEAAHKRAKQNGKGQGSDGLIRTARARQRLIRDELRAKGAALYAEEAAEFVARVESYWAAAKAVSKARRKASQARPSPAPVSAKVSTARPQSASKPRPAGAAKARTRAATPAPVGVAAASTARAEGMRKSANRTKPVKPRSGRSPRKT